MTIYPDNIIFSINMLLTKNKAYYNEMRLLSGGILAKDINLEGYLVETNFGNKIVPVSIVAPDMAMLTYNKVSDIYARILENSAQIRDIVAQSELLDLDQLEVAKLSIAALGFENAEWLLGVSFEDNYITLTIDAGLVDISIDNVLNSAWTFEDGYKTELATTNKIISATEEVVLSGAFSLSPDASLTMENLGPRLHMALSDLQSLIRGSITIVDAPNVTGDLSDLGGKLTGSLVIPGVIQITGDLSDLEGKLTDTLNIAGTTLITGDLLDLGGNLKGSLNISGATLITGDLDDIGGNLKDLINIENCASISGVYSPDVNTPSESYLVGSGMTSDDVDDTLKAYAYALNIKLDGIFDAEGMARSSASDAAIVNLLKKNWTIKALNRPIQLSCGLGLFDLDTGGNLLGAIWHFKDGTTSVADQPNRTLTSREFIYLSGDFLGSPSFEFIASSLGDRLKLDLSDLLGYIQTKVDISGCTKVTGDLADLAGNLTTGLNTTDCNLITGSLASLEGHISDLLIVEGCPLITGAYIPINDSNVPNATNISDTGISAIDVDSIVNSYATFSVLAKTLIGENMDRTDNSDLSMANLLLKNWTITGLDLPIKLTIDGDTIETEIHGLTDVAWSFEDWTVEFTENPVKTIAGLQDMYISGAFNTGPVVNRIWNQVYTGSSFDISDVDGNAVLVNKGDFIYNGLNETNIVGFDDIPNPNYSTWDYSLEMPTGEWEHSMSIGTDVYVKQTESPYTLWHNDTLTGTWDYTLAPPSGDWVDPVIVGTDIYVKQSVSPYAIWKYDTLTDVWDSTLAGVSGNWTNPVAINTDIYVKQVFGPYAIWKYNTLTDAWDYTISAPTGNWDYPVAIGLDIYVKQGDSPYAFWKYDTLIDTWDYSLTAPTGNWSYPVLIERSLYVKQAHGPYSVWQYDTLVDEWNYDLSVPAGDWSVPVVANGNIYTRQLAVPYSAWEYNIAKDTWSEDFANTWTYSIEVGTDIYMKQVASPYAIWKYDTLTGEWDRNLSVPAGDWINPVVVGTSIFMRQEDSPYRIWKYDTASDVWVYTLRIPSADWTYPVAIGTDIYVEKVDAPYSIWKYNTLTNTWKENLADIWDYALTPPTGEWYYPLVIGTDIYIRQSSSPYATWKYDTVMDDWDEVDMVWDDVFVAPSITLDRPTVVGTDIYFRQTTSPYRAIWVLDALDSTKTPATQTIPSVEAATSGNDLKATISGYLEMKDPSLDDVFEGFISREDVWSSGMSVTATPMISLNAFNQGSSLKSSIASLRGKITGALTLANCTSVTGNISSLNGNLQTGLVLENCNQITGDLSSLEGALENLNIAGCGLITGSLEDIGQMKVTSLIATNCSLITGNIASLNGRINKSLSAEGCPSLKGDLATLGGAIEDTLYLDAPGIYGTYVPVGAGTPTITHLSSTGLSVTEINDTLIAYANAAIPKSNGQFHAVDKYRNADSDAAVATLLGRGWTINVLEL